MKKFRKQLAILIMACLVLTILVACAQDTPDEAAPAEAAPAPAEAAPAEAAPEPAPAPEGITREETLIWLTPDLPPGIDINFYSSMPGMEVMRNVFESFLIFPPVLDESGFLVPDFENPQGALAESWEILDDGRTIILHLRQGIISHMGNELTAHDYVNQRLRSNRLVGTDNWWNNALGVTDVETQIVALDDYTLKVSVDYPNPIFVSLMAHMSNHVVDYPAYAAAMTPDDPDGTIWSNLQGSGHGAYRIVSYTPGDNITMVANEHYWNRDNVPHFFQQVIFREVPSSSSRLALVISGDADAATFLSPAELREAEGHDGVKVMSWRSNILTRVEFNTTAPPFDNPLVRKALNFATPIDHILETVYLGTASPMRSTTPSAYPSFTDEFFQFEFDLDRAAELLAEAGFPDGFDTTIQFMPIHPQEEQIAIILRDSFAQIGVNVELQIVQAADFWHLGNTRGFCGMFIFSDMPGTVDGGFSAFLWLRSTAMSNFSGYHNEEVDALFYEAMGTIDPEIRDANFRRIQEITVWEDPAWIPIAEPGFHLAVRDDIYGLFWQTLQEIRWSHAYRR